QHYQDDISFSNLAEKFGFTLEYLSKIFKKYSNNTPSKYLIKLRMNEAKRLLLTNPDLKIQNIAELVGYIPVYILAEHLKHIQVFNQVNSVYNTNYKRKS